MRSYPLWPFSPCVIISIFLFSIIGLQPAHAQRGKKQRDRSASKSETPVAPQEKPAPRLKRYANTLDVTAPWLQSKYAAFAFEYPEHWRLMSSMENEKNFVAAIHELPIAGDTLSADFIIVGPLDFDFGQTDSAATVVMLRRMASQFGQTLRPSMKDLMKISEGITFVGGVMGYETRYQSMLSDSALEGVTTYTRTIFIPKTAHHDGMLIALSTTSVTPGMTSVADVGEVGELGALLRSFVIPTWEIGKRPPSHTFFKEADSAGPGLVRYVNRREKVHASLRQYFVDFSFTFPDEWIFEPSTLDTSGSFISVSHGMPTSQGIAMIDLFNVGPVFFVNAKKIVGKTEAEMDSILTPILRELIGKMEMDARTGLDNYERVSEGWTTFRGEKGYEIRFKGTISNSTMAGYGRYVIVTPTDSRYGLIIKIRATSLSRDVRGPEDVGEKGELAKVVESFTFGPGK